MGTLKILDRNGRKIYANSGFEGARSGRRLSSWAASSSGINALISNSISSLRARARHLRRNNPFADGGVDSLVADLIGTSISPSWLLDDKELKKIIQELWSEWVEEADFNEIYDFYGLQSLVAQALVESGEALVWMKVQPKNSDFAVPLQLQVLEGDHLDETYNDTLPNGNEVRMGIEFNKRGKRVNYHLWPEHPGEMYGFQLNRISVPADQICHIYKATRPGQLRGTPWLSSSLVKLYEFDQYDDAELVRKKCAAMFGGFITEPAGGTDATMPFGGSDEEDDNSRDIVPLEPGTFPVLPPGMEVQFSQPADVGGNYEKFGKQQLRAISKGLGTTYENFTGDLTDVNLASIRAGRLDYQRKCKQIQYHVISFQMCRKISHAFLNTAILSGALSIKDYAQKKRKYWKIKWRPDAWALTEPVKEQLAAQLRIRNGITSLPQEREEYGGDNEQINIEIEESNKNIDAKKFVFDSDPRNTAKSGTVQALETATVTDNGGDK